MSRLYDRLIAALPRRDLEALDVEERSSLERARGKVVRADEVAEYMQSLAGGKSWDLFGDFPRVVPPFDRTFVEFRHRQDGQVWVLGLLFERDEFFYEVPFEEALGIVGEEQLDRVVGWARARLSGGIKTVEDLRKFASYGRPAGLAASAGVGEDELSADGSEPQGLRRRYEDVTARARWACRVSLFFEEQKGKPIGPMLRWRMLVAPDGSMVRRDDGEPALDSEAVVGGEETKEGLGAALLPALFALSLMHCDNVVERAHEPPKKVSKKFEKRTGRPLTRYYTLEIEPMKRVLRREGRVEDLGLRRALHICRGHFKTYTEDKPLFGKYVGTFFFRDHVRGAKESGEIAKDYDVKTPR